MNTILKKISVLIHKLSGDEKQDRQRVKPIARTVRLDPQQVEKSIQPTVEQVHRHSHG